MKKRISSLRERYKRIPVQVRAAFWFLTSSVMQRGISVITTPIFTRILSTGDYGQYTVFNSWLDIVTIFVTLRLYFGVFSQGLVKFSEDKDAYASSMQGLGFVLSTLWTLLYLAARPFWNRLFGLTTVQMLAMLVMIWSSGAFRFWATTQRNEYKYRLLVLVSLLISILKPVLGIALVLNAEDKATARILGLAIAELAGYSWCFFVQLRRGKRFYSRKYWKHALLFNLPLLPHYLSQVVLNSSDRIMIKSMVGVSEAGIYGLAYSLSRLMQMVNQALLQTFSPWAYRKLKARREMELNAFAVPMLVGVGCANLLVIALAPELIALFAPRAYHEAVWIVPPVAMSMYFTFAYGLFSLVEFYYEKTKRIMLASSAAAGLNLLLNYIFIRRCGYFAAGYTTLFCYMLYALAHYIFMRGICRTELDNAALFEPKSLLGLTLGFLGLGFLFLFSYRVTALRYAVCLALLGLGFLCRKRLLAYARMIVGLRKKPQSPE